ncbi:MAG: response regulator [Alphaproteobacteria bacterium]
MKSNTPVQILVVEDNPGDARLICESFDRITQATSIEVKKDGDEALSHLRQRIHAARPVDLVLLDLNLPGRHGREVLSEVKADRHLHCTPIIILSSSTSHRDITDCYERHANAYVTKPDDFDDFVKLAQAIGAFWVDSVTMATDPGLSFPMTLETS